MSKIVGVVVLVVGLGLNGRAEMIRTSAGLWVDEGTTTIEGIVYVVRTRSDGRKAFRVGSGWSSTPLPLGKKLIEVSDAFSSGTVSLSDGTTGALHVSDRVIISR